MSHQQPPPGWNQQPGQPQWNQQPGQPQWNQQPGQPQWTQGPPPPPPPPPPAVPPGGGSSRGRKALIGVLALALVVAAGVGIWFFTSSGEEDGEVFLEAASAPGSDPFSETTFAIEPDPTIAQPASQAAPASTSTASTATSGGQRGLYGGTQDKVACDAGAMVAFLKANPAKAKAWVDALNADPDLGWEQGALTVDSIELYVSTLTPIILVQDTRVTNHGFINNRPTPFQSVIQKGSGVLVDKFGVPRVRCFCGNPLLPPKASKKKVTFRGKAWPDFSQGSLVVVQRNKTPITAFAVAVPARPGGQVVSQPVGPVSCASLKPQASGTAAPVRCTLPSGVKVSPTATVAPTPAAPPTDVPTDTPTPTATTDVPTPTVPTSPVPSTPATSDALPPTPATNSVTRTPKPAPSPTRTSTPPAEPRLSGRNRAEGDKVVSQVTLTGYPPNTRVNFTCVDSAGTDLGGFSIAIDSQGSGASGWNICRRPSGELAQISGDVGPAWRG